MVWFLINSRGFARHTFVSKVNCSEIRPTVPNDVALWPGTFVAARSLETALLNSLHKVYVSLDLSVTKKGNFVLCFRVNNYHAVRKLQRRCAEYQPSARRTHPAQRKLRWYVLMLVHGSFQV
jgi:hypothetical protein